MPATLFLHTLLDGEATDLRVEHGLIAARRPASAAPAPAFTPRPGDEVVRGGMITPPFAEPHTHLDAALLGHRAPNRSGTLTEGIANWSRLRDGLTAEDVRERALRTLEMYASYGALRVRTHVDTGNLTAVQALLDLRDEVAATGITLQVTAFPQEGILRAPGRLAAWEQAVKLGCDAVGAIPHFERTTEEGWRTVRMAFDLAEAHGLMVDLHCDETDDPASTNLEVVCAETLDRGFQGRVIAGHCTSLHSQPGPRAAKVIGLVAESGVQIVTNPLDNIVLQGRFDPYPRRRGHTRVDELWQAGATVGIGHDSVMDPWYRLGTANLLDAAYMLVHYAHLTSEAHMQRCLRTLHHENHLPFGGPPKLEQGERAQLLWWPEADAIEVLRVRPVPRVWR
jgi:cytosine deaminase